MAMIKLSEDWQIVDPFNNGFKCLNHIPCYNIQSDIAGCACEHRRCYTCSEFPSENVIKKFDFICQNA